MTSNSLTAQRMLVLTALKTSDYGLTTIELRELHDVMMIAARVHELHHQKNENIKTTRTKSISAQGSGCLAALYVLMTVLWSE